MFLLRLFNLDLVGWCMKFWLYFIVFMLVVQVLKVVIVGLGWVAAVVLACVAIFLLIKFVGFLYRKIYFALNPEEKRRHLEALERERRAREDDKARESERALVLERQLKEKDEADLKEREKIWALGLEQAKRREFERVSLRDADTQDVPYSYKVGRHANEALAYRYGIANQIKRVKEYWYFGKGGVKLRNPDKDSIYFEDANSICLRKLRKVKQSVYEVELSDCRGRKAIAVIEAGTEYVKTFLPIDEKWHSANDEFELVVKGNRTFTLKELASLHVIKTVKSKDVN